MPEHPAAVSVTQRIGRYDVVGPLATGGMAEILLGRLVGPSGFERPVVIKRMLPQLSQTRDFVDMFVDEARILAGLRHPNVVHVYELVSEDDELVLVMEYLEGESVAGTLRRLWSQGEELDPATAAHIVAEACAGLHAAHELADERGKRRGLVHRDVSPHNVFVTYAGQVKLLDFGIAKAADRITRTEAGQVKGKFAYMSPEQCLGKALDRRSDIFALGIILYELTTGRQLFKRATEHLTFKAICEQSVVPPSEVVPSYPKALEAICMRALSRRPAERYATAADMRRDLVKAELGGAGLPEEALASLMQRIFADRIEEKREMLRKVRSGSGLTRIPPAETDYDVDLPTVDGASAIRSSPKSHRRWWIAPVLGGAALAAWWYVAPTPQRAGRAFEIPVTLSAPVPQPGEVVLHVETKPPGATILVNDVERGTTPADVKVQRAERPLDVEVRLVGHQLRKEKVIPDADRRLVWELTRATRAKASASSDDDYYRFE